MKKYTLSSELARVLPEYVLIKVLSQLLRNFEKTIGGSTGIFSKNQKNAVNLYLLIEVFTFVKNIFDIHGFRLVVDILLANNLL